MSEAKRVGATGGLLGRIGKLATATGAAVAVATGVLGTGLLATGLSAQSRCHVQDERRLTGSAAEAVSIDAGAGRLVVTGREGADGISVVATLCASSQELLDGLRITLNESVGRSRIDTDYPNRRGSWSGRRYARIDMVVEVPAGTDVGVDDNSGGASVSGVGAVRIRDGSGRLMLRDVGSVVLEDGSGSVEIVGVTGDVEMEDGSGSVAIESVTGDVEVEDGSGGLDIREVGGDVLVSDGSGRIEIEGVGGSVRIARMGSGGVSVRDVDGDLVVSSGRRERIRYSDIRGSLDLPPAKRKGRGGSG